MWSNHLWLYIFPFTATYSKEVVVINATSQEIKSNEEKLKYQLQMCQFSSVHVHNSSLLPTLLQLTRLQNSH